GQVEDERRAFAVEEPAVRAQVRGAVLDPAEVDQEAVERPEEGRAPAPLDLPGEAVRPAPPEADVALDRASPVRARDLQRQRARHRAALDGQGDHPAAHHVAGTPLRLPARHRAGVAVAVRTAAAVARALPARAFAAAVRVLAAVLAVAAL